MIYHFEEVFKRTPFSTKRLIEKIVSQMFRFPYQPSKAHVWYLDLFSNHIYNIPQQNQKYLNFKFLS